MEPKIPALWLTYAWKDNEEEQVDHIYHELLSVGLDVKLDRTQLVAGKRLWQQIESGIVDPAVSDGWAIYATKNSLESEPCQEEISYALDRALRSRGKNFPLIGIFPEDLDRSIVPSAISTRLYVNLRDPDWKQEVARALKATSVRKSITKPDPFFFKVHDVAWGKCIEVRPRSGRWHPFFAMVVDSERELMAALFTGPSNYPINYGTLIGGDCKNDRGWSGISTTNLVDSLNSAYINFSSLPSSIYFGSQSGDGHWTYTFNK